MSTRFLKMDDDNVQSAVLFDVDGVLADISHRLHLCPGRPEATAQASWTAYCNKAWKDVPIKQYIELAEMLYHSGYAVLLGTNRNESERHTLASWLRSYAVPYDRLLMRAEGHHGDKQWVLDAVDRQYRVVMALDDDRRHCELYERAGVSTLYVHSGYYEGITDDVYFSSQFVPSGGEGKADGESWSEFYGRIGAAPVTWSKIPDGAIQQQVPGPTLHAGPWD